MIVKERQVQTDALQYKLQKNRPLTLSNKHTRKVGLNSNKYN